ncbi:pre-mRNA splicing factor [Phyllosticta citribraziliensis]|uniref:Pre-mRNA splicing factor n=1 Tax=Phyllosticta citribraziliensis TaxID=989973 RepID=A0ABR1M4G2_9PEZI
MDINSLLSPQESPASDTTPPPQPPQQHHHHHHHHHPPPPPPQYHHSPPQQPHHHHHHQRPGRHQTRKSSGLSQSVNAYSSPPPHQEYLHHHQPQTQTQPQPQPQPQPPYQHHHQQSQLSTSAVAPHNYGLLNAPKATAPTAQLRSPLQQIADREARSQPPRRQISTQGIDALAEIALQNPHQQPARQSPAGLRSPHVYQRPASVSRPTSYQNISSLARSLSSNSSKDVAMSDSSQSSRVLSAGALSPADNQAVNELVAHLNEKSYDFPSHARLVGLLHKGLHDHINPPDTPEVKRDPRTYELLNELRRARLSMSSKFAMTEDAWIAWLNDEKMLSRSIDDRIGVMELCAKAVQEEPASAALWRFYGDYMYELWAAAFSVEPSDWTEDEKTIGREAFTWQTMTEVWEQGLASTQWHMNDSNVVWDRWMEIMLADLERHPDPHAQQTLKNAFTDRLVKPHATWDSTFQMFSGFISKYENAAYEETMMVMTKRAAQSKQQYSLREHFETKIDRALKAGDKDAEWEVYSQYLEWELRNKGVFSFNMINALYERATVRFSLDATVWEDYFQFLIEHPDPAVPALPVLERATKHCPWSGNLWSHWLLTLEAEGKPFIDMENVKHRATETGLLDVGGMEELLKVYVAWCGYLRRKAFDVGSTEDDIDIAEVGIRSALEHVKEIGEQRYGKNFQGDPQYRLERIHIKFVTQNGQVDVARQCWKALIPKQENSYDFWYRYYIFEMVLWSKWVIRDKGNAGQPLESPREATNLLRQALKRVATMDWPEQLVQMFLNHCEQHETVQEYRIAILETRTANKDVAARRQKEAAEAAEAAAAYQAQFSAAAADVETEDATLNAKRKRDGEAALEENAAKKSKQGDADAPNFETTAAQPKRDREHTTIIVKNIPQDASETRIRQFFRGCGKINSLALVTEKDGVKSATIEFETPEDAQFAQSRDGKDFDGNAVKISLGTGTTLFVANYPPEADEKYMRNLFGQYGEVVQVRFPSLKYNTHRRFCYVSFASGEEADAASRALDGAGLSGGLKLVAKLSDPNRAEARHGAQYEGREVVVGNVHNGASEQEIKDFINDYAPDGLQSVRVPLNVSGKNKGVAFVVYDTKDNAQKACELLEAKALRHRIVRANISDPDRGKTKRHATTVIGTNPNAASASPEPSSNSPTAATNGNGVHESGPDTRRERTIALMNIPDTVNDARVRALLTPFGPLRKLILMPEHGGAIVEFVNVADAGRAALGVEGQEVAEGARVRVGSVEEMKRERGTERAQKGQFGEKGKGGAKKNAKDGEASKTDGNSASSSGLALAPQAPRVNRPGQSRGSRRGGLGVKRGAPAGLPSRATAAAAVEKGGNDVEMGGTGAAAAAGSSTRKSNADFKAMFLASKQDQQEKEKSAAPPAEADGGGGGGGGAERKE